MEIIYDDQWLSVVNKPAGLLVIPAPQNKKRTTTDILNDQAKEQGQSFRFHPCHRLDKETSGLLIYAKGKSAQNKIMDLFKDKLIKKAYLAFVHGEPRKKEGIIQSLVEGRESVTKYKLLEVKNKFSVLEVDPLTGRKNQIRIHLKSIGHPVLGEDKFCFRKDFSFRVNRLCLHAFKLEFKHPITGKQLSLKASLPNHMKELLTRQ